MRNAPVNTKREIVIRYQLTEERMVFYGIDFHSEDTGGFDPYDSLMFLPMQYHIKVPGGCPKHQNDCMTWANQKLIKSPYFDVDILRHGINGVKQGVDMSDGDGFALYFCKGISLKDRLRLFEAVKLEVRELYDMSTFYENISDDEKADEGYDPDDDCHVIFLDETPK